MSNTLFPGLPDYVGPQSGYYGLVHHNVLFEWSDGIDERVEYIKHCKPKSERALRLACLIYIDLAECPAVATLLAARAEYQKVVQAANAEYEKIWQQANAEYQQVVQQAHAEYLKVRQPAYAEYDKVEQAAYAEYQKVGQAANAEYARVAQPAHADIEAYIRRYIPDLPWSGSQLVFS